MHKPLRGVGWHGNLSSSKPNPKQSVCSLLKMEVCEHRDEHICVLVNQTAPNWPYYIVIVRWIPSNLSILRNGWIFKDFSAQRAQMAGTWMQSWQPARCSAQRPAGTVLIAAYYIFLQAGCRDRASFPGKWSAARSVPGSTNGRAP